MTLKERIKNFLPNMEKGIKRFPITMIFSVAIFILSVYLIEIEAKMKTDSLLFKRLEKVLILFILGIPISASLELIREKYFSNKKILSARIVEGVITLLLLCAVKMVYMPHEVREYYIELVFIWIISYLIFLLIPVIKRGDDSEKYIQTVVMNKIITVVFSGILFAGLAAIIAAIDVLLINLDSKIYMDAYAFTVCIFGIPFFVSRLRGINESLEEYEIETIFKVLLKYIIIPLILVYTVILYIYLGKIIVQMEIPKGVVSHQVLWYMTFSLFIIVFVTPLTKKDKIINEFKKNFPKVSIPLIILSLVAIFQRINQYGITESRYYIVIIGLWLLFCMIFYIFRTKLTVIIVSVIAIILVAVYSPVNARKISLISQNKRLEKLLVENGLLKNGKLEKNPKLDRKTKAEIADVFSYITRQKISDLKPFGKADGKPYKSIDEFQDAIGMNGNWYGYGSLDEMEEKITYILKGENRYISKTYGYDYLITFYNAYINDPVPWEVVSEEYEARLKDKDLTILDKNKKELLKINIEEVLKEIMERKELKSENNYQMSKNGTVEIPKNAMEYTGENENIKYKIIIKSFEINKKQNGNISFEGYSMVLSFSGK